MSPEAPDEATLSREREKIRGWRDLGFDVGGLEELLETDYQAYRKRRLEILKGQAERPQAPGKVKKFKRVDAAPGPVPGEMEPGEPTEQPSREEPPAPVPVEEEAGGREEPEPPEPEEEPREETPPEPARTAPAPAGPAGPADGQPILLVGDPLVPIKRSPKPKEEGKVIVVGADKSARPRRRRGGRTVSAGAGAAPKKAAGRRVEEVEEDDGGYEDVEEGDEPDDEDYYADQEYDEDLGDGEVEEGEDDDGDEYDGEEGEEEEERPRKRRRGKGKKKGRKSSSWAPLGVVVVISLLVMAYFFGLIDTGDGGEEGEKLEASFRILFPGDGNGLIAGQLVTFDASNSTGEELTFTWRTDSAFVATGGEGTALLEGYFTDEGEYDVTLELEDGNGDSATLERTLGVDPLVVVPSDENLGDEAEYDADGGLLVYNPDGIFSFEQELDQPIEGFGDVRTVDVTVHTIDLDLFTEDDAPMTMRILGDTTRVDDGFFDTHDVYSRQVDQDLTVVGTAQGDSSVLGDDLTGDIVGNIITSERNHIDLTKDVTVQTEVENSMDITVSTNALGAGAAMSERYTSEAEALVFTDLGGGDSGFHLSDISESFEVDDVGSLQRGDSSYAWSVQGVDRAGGLPCLRVHMTVDQDTMERNGLTEFHVRLWVAHDISLPVRYMIHGVGDNDGNELEFDYRYEMRYYNAGTVPVPKGECPGLGGGSGGGGTNGTNGTGRPAGHFASDYSESGNADASMVAGEFTDSWKYLPESGGTPNSFQHFTPQQAIDLAKGEAAWDGYVAQHPDAYVVDAVNNKTGDGDYLWHMYLGEEGSTEGLEIRATYDPGSGDTGVEVSEADVDKPTNSTSDFPVLLTFSGCEQVLEDIPNDDVGRLVDARVFKGATRGSIDLAAVDFGVTANFAYPTLDLSAFTNLQRIRYAFQITEVEESGGGTTTDTYRAAVNAETGQFLYSGTVVESSPGGISFIGW